MYKNDVKNDIFNTTVTFAEIINFIAGKVEVKSISLNECLEIFATNKAFNNRPGTLRYYVTNIKNVIRFLKQINVTNTSDINNGVIESLIIYYSKLGNKPNSINKRITSFIYMLRFVSKLGVITFPNVSYTKLKEVAPKIESIKPTELNRLLNYVDKLTIKTRLMFYLMLTTGIRLNELCNIKVSNIDLTNDLIYLDFTKTSTPRTIYIQEYVKKILIKYLKKIKSKNVYLFTNTNQPLNTNTFKLFCRRTKKALKITLSANRLRHLYATSLLKNGCDIKCVSVLLGHTNIKTTSRYLDYTDEELKEKNNKFNVLTNFETKK